MADAILDAVLDTLKTLPLLYLVYLLILFLQRRMNLGVVIGRQERRFGPILGAALGSIPQCGFSAACAELYGAQLIGAGTLISVFLATSDEAIPVLLSHPGQFPQVLLLLAAKFVLAIAAGYLFAHTFFRKETAKIAQNALYDEEEYAADEYEKYLAGQTQNNPDGGNGAVSEQQDEDGLLPGDEEIGQISCGCGRCSGNIFLSALYHTARTGVFIAVTLTVINILLHLLGDENLSRILLSGSVFQPFATALIGLIPGCAISVILVELFVSGSITFGAAVAGLSTGAGFGYLILLGRCSSKRQCFKIIACTYLAAVAAGLLLQLTVG